MNVATTYPSYCLSGNIPDLVLKSNTEFVTVSIYIDSELLHAARLYFDHSGSVTMQLDKIISPALNRSLPGGESLLLSSPMPVVTIHVDEQKVVEFAVVKGGIAAVLADQDVWLATNFLTWRPQVDKTLWNIPNWLSIASVDNSDLVITARCVDGKDYDHLVAGLEPGRLYDLNCTFSRIAALFEKQPVWFDVYTRKEGVIRTYRQRFLLASSMSGMDAFVYLSSLGGFDTVIYTGEKTAVSDIDTQTLDSDGAVVEFDVDFKRIYSKQTGFIDPKYVAYHGEFFRSTLRYHLLNGILQRIVVTEPDMATALWKPNNWSFNFSYSDEPDYLSLERQETLPDELEIVTDAAESFTLAPRLFELKPADVGADVLIPVQHLWEDKWRYLSLSQIVSKVVSETGGSIDLTGYAKLTDIPTTLPASDVHTWAKKAEKPSYTHNEVGALGATETAVNSDKLGDKELSEFALKVDLHAHDNKSTLDALTSEKINIWDDSASKSHVHDQGVDTTDSVVFSGVRSNGPITSSGEIIAYQASDSDSGGGSGGGAVTLDELIDVVITSPKAGDLLKYNGERWENVSEVIIDGGNYKIV